MYISETRQNKSKLFSVQENELPSIDSPEKLIGDLHKSAILSEVRNNKTIQDKFIEQAKKTVGNELDSINQENIFRRQKTTYDANKEACRIYGVDDHVPLWQVRIMKVGASFWFIIYWLFASFTIAPVNIFFKGINTFIKNNIIVFLFAILCYLIIIIGIPIFISLL